MTILFYLNDVEGGGETAFPVANNDTVDIVVSFCLPSNSGYLKFMLLTLLSLVARKPIFGVSDQVRQKPGHTATEA